MDALREFLIRRWFLLGLGLVLAVGFTFADASASAADRVPRRAIVAAVLFVTALPLELAALGRTLRRPGPALLAVAINFGLVPPLAWLAGRGLPEELAIGMVIMAAIPCTLASAAVWTRRAGGNDAVAILVTMITNLACFIVTPLWLKWLIRTEVTLELGPLVTRLLLLVVVPIVVAQLLRGYRPLAVWATRHKTALGATAQIGILSMVWIGAVKSGVQLGEVEGAAIGAAAWAAMLVAVVVVHVVALVVGYGLAAAARMETGDRIAVGISGSQKTLMVGLDIALQFFGGLAILPMVAYHVGQLLIDTVVVDWWRERRSDE